MAGTRRKLRPHQRVSRPVVSGLASSEVPEVLYGGRWRHPAGVVPAGLGPAPRVRRHCHPFSGTTEPLQRPEGIGPADFTSSDSSFIFRVISCRNLVWRTQRPDNEPQLLKPGPPFLNARLVSCSGSWSLWGRWSASSLGRSEKRLL